MTQTLHLVRHAQCSAFLVLLLIASPGKLAAQPSEASYLGVSSCAAAACHGSPQQVSRPAWQSAYTVWAMQDLHANASLTLYNDRSRQMVQILRGQETSNVQHQEFLQARCMGCHATPSRSSTLTDGVGCESCHGAARTWMEPHTRTSWTKLTAEEKHSQGWINTVDLSERATVCVRCHVGPGGQQGEFFDVNHDLIAAGHPRLAFEFAAYLTHLPAHWDVARDRTWEDKSQQKQRSDFDSQVWIAGQLATSLASVALLESRAAGALAGRRVWPEFAEYDCYACHRTLQPQAMSPAGSRGIAAWGTWYTPMLRLIARESNNKQILPALDDLNSAMLRPAPDANIVGRLAAAAIIPIDELLQDSRAWPKPAALRAALIEQSKNLRNRDEVTQWYLAVAAIRGTHSISPDRPLDSALAELRRQLEQPQFPTTPDLQQLLTRVGETLK